MLSAAVLRKVLVHKCMAQCDNTLHTILLFGSVQHSFSLLPRQSNIKEVVIPRGSKGYGFAMRGVKGTYNTSACNDISVYMFSSSLPTSQVKENDESNQQQVAIIQLVLLIFRT